MDGGIAILVVLVAGVYVLSRMASYARHTSQAEEFRRELIKEYLRQKRIDELYGRDEE